MEAREQRTRERWAREVLEGLEDPALFAAETDLPTLRKALDPRWLGEPRPDLAAPLGRFLIHGDDAARRAALRMYLRSASEAQVSASAEAAAAGAVPDAVDWADAGSSAFQAAQSGGPDEAPRASLLLAWLVRLCPSLEDPRDRSNALRLLMTEDPDAAVRLVVEAVGEEQRADAALAELASLQSWRRRAFDRPAEARARNLPSP